MIEEKGGVSQGVAQRVKTVDSLVDTNECTTSEYMLAFILNS